MEANRKETGRRSGPVKQVRREVQAQGGGGEERHRADFYIAMISS